LAKLGRQLFYLASKKEKYCLDWFFYIIAAIIQLNILNKEHKPVALNKIWTS